MKLEIVVVDLQLPRAVKTWAVRLGIPVALLLGGGAVAWAGGLVTWTNGQTLDASQLNGNFAYLQSEIDALNTTVAAVPKVTEWQSSCPSITWSNGSPAAASATCFWRRVGDTIEVSLHATFTSASSDITFGLPSGVTTSTSKTSGSGGAYGYGMVSYGSGASGWWDLVHCFPSPWSSGVACNDGSHDSSGAPWLGNGWPSAASWGADIHYFLPISGWTSSTP